MTIRSHTCPNCGAPLEIPDDHDKFFTCQFCNTVLEDEASRSERQIGVTRIKISTTPPAPLGVPVSMPAAPQNTGSRSGCVVFLLILLVIAGISGVVFSASGLTVGELIGSVGDGNNGSGGNDGISINDVNEALGPQVYYYGLTRMFPSPDDTTPDFVGVASLSDQTTRMVYVDWDRETPFLWQSEPLPDEANYVHNQLIADNTMLYLSYETYVQAFNRADGTTAWKATLSDEIQSSICHDCLQLINGSVVALTADGTLQAFDTQTGAATWNVRLAATPRQLIDFGGNPAVLDEEEDVVGLNIYALADGALQQRIVPQCPNDPFPNDPQGPYIYDHIPVAPNGENIYFVASLFEPGCIQKWDTVSGIQVWQATFPVQAIRSYEIEHMLFTDDSLYFTNDYALFAVSLADGVFREVSAPEDYNLSPLGARDGVVVAAAERTRGTRRHEIWSIDAASGEQLWAYVPEATNILDGFVGIVGDDGVWQARLTASGLTIVQIIDDPPRIIIETLSLADGASGGPKTIPLPNETGILGGGITAWLRDEVWARTDGGLIIIDIASGTETTTWP